MDRKHASQACQTSRPFLIPWTGIISNMKGYFQGKIRHRRNQDKLHVRGNLYFDAA